MKENRQMSGKSRNPSRSCKACGAPVKANVRFCVACAIQRKAARVGIVHLPCTTRAALGLGGISEKNNPPPRSTRQKN